MFNSLYIIQIAKSVAINFVLVVPDLYWVYQSNVFDDEQYLLRDPQCNDTESGTLLTCIGPMLEWFLS